MNSLLFPAFVPAPPVPQPPSAAPAPPAHPPPPHEDEPVSKKMKTEDNLIPEEEFLRRNKVFESSDVLKMCCIGIGNQCHLSIFKSYDLHVDIIHNTGLKLSADSVTNHQVKCVNFHFLTFISKLASL